MCSRYLYLSAALALLASCGSGTLGVIALADSGPNDDPAASPTVVSDVLVAGGVERAAVSPVDFTFRLNDAESSPASVEVWVIPPAGPPLAALLDGAPGLAGLASSPIGVVHAFAWDYESQLPTGAGFSSGFRIEVRLVLGNGAVASTPFDVGNDPPSVVSAAPPTGVTAGIVPVDIVVADSSGDPLAMTVEYRFVEDGPAWYPATLVGTPPDNVVSSPGGTALTVFWNAPVDGPGRDGMAALRLTTDDGMASSVPFETAPFEIDGNSPPIAIVDGSSFLANPDERRGIPIPFRIIDPEGDPVRVVFQWRTPYQAYPTLPDDVADLDPILASNALRRQHQIAGEFPSAWEGVVRPMDSASVGLPEIGQIASTVAARGIEGRAIQFLRPRAALQSVTAGWASNPLVNPTDLVARQDARTAYVCDEPAPGTWRIQVVDLQTGSLLSQVAAGPEGTPQVLEPGQDDEELLLAVGTAGSWTVLNIAILTGAVQVLGQSDVATLGVVRGLASTGQQSALLCVATSLVSVTPDGTTVLLADLDDPTDLVLDPIRSDRAFVSEMTGVDPQSDLPDGRIVAIDLRTLERRPVITSGPSPLRPASLALRRAGPHLLALVDANPVDGVHELIGIDVSSGESGTAFEMVSAVPDGAQSLGSGPDDLIMLLLPGSELAVSGGVQQVRVITAADPQAHAVSLDSPLDPLLVPGQRWRIPAGVGAGELPSPEVEQLFNWDVQDLLDGNEVVLRAVPYDMRSGVTSDTGAPRDIRSSLVVSTLTFGGSHPLSGVSGLDAVDLDSDGDVDVVTANTGSDELTIFYQSAPGVFPDAPSTTLTGIPILAPMTEPVAVRAVDIDDDGILDVVSANRASDNVSLCLQTSPGVFQTQPVALGLPGSEPVDVAAGDLNGDGLTDIVTANAGSEDLTIYLQLAGGLYQASPSLTLGGPGSTGAPSAVAVGDLDGDGDIDVASSNKGADTVTIFFQVAPGTFPAAPSVTLGGPGLTDGPSSLDLGDVDRDGRLDVAVSNGAGNSVSVFLQDPAGAFPSVPDFVLSAAAGPVGPVHVRLADVNGDGFLDVVTADLDDSLTVFPWRPALDDFASQPFDVQAGGALSSPSSLAVNDYDGDGLLDVAVANSLAGEVAVLFQSAGGAFAPVVADAVLGDATDSPGASGVAVGDLDGDGDLDLAVASPDRSRLLVYEQLSPAKLGTEPTQVLGSDVQTPGPAALAAADLNGDLRVDLVCADAVAGSLFVFFQVADGTFPTLPDLQLGQGALGGCAWVVAADFDLDGDLDLACANPLDDDIAVFIQTSPGGFAVAPAQRLGGPVTTAGPVHVSACDVDADGDVDLISTNVAGDSVTLFLQDSGVFPTVPDVTLGGTAATDAPVAAVSADVDGDGDVDIVCCCSGNDLLAVFLQDQGGGFSTVPDLTLADASLVEPTTVSAADVDRDGDLDLVAGSRGSDRITIFRQSLPGTFVMYRAIGSAAYTPSPVSLVITDIEGDGDVDLVSAQPDLDRVVVYFGSH